MDTLLLDEKQISQELISLTERIDSYAADVDQQDTENVAAKAAEEVKHQQQQQQQQEPETILSEVKTFQDYLVRHGGYYGGWDDLSHAAFMKLRQKYGANDARFLASCVSSIPGIGFKDAQDHETWYRKFKTLLDAKKEAIRLWKEQKAAAALKAEQELEKTKETCKDVSAMKLELEIEAREKSKRELALWKEKQQKIVNERKEREREHKEKLAQEHERWREKNEILKEKVQQHSREKALQEAIEKQLLEEARQLEQCAKEMAAKMELDRMKQKDAELMAQKKERELKRLLSKQEREERLQRIRSTVS
ncbi:UNVERIFIED_CONTAM: hypothetical protein HDU68_007862 [Siphonaria sp. JEL0065]|nr:hypothetical protein HDU68_007862 [Siphonaria sp. JEL0065]